LSRATRAVVLALAACAAAGAAETGGAPPLLYELPAAGSYELPVIDRVREHRLLDSGGELEPLLGLPEGSCALVAFVYLHCTDPNGCPLALASLQQTDRAIAARDDLRGRVRLVTVSFDPARDGPEAMQGLRRNMAPRGDWRFLTAASQAELEPVLADYGQDAVPVLTGGGHDTGLMRHVAKVFLVDSDGGVRNIYSSGFLDHRLLLRDVETLLRAR
jgi:cytochrome oxidase Cu insertion factor (SCO1/SenC/PrrC family)